MPAASRGGCCRRAHQPSLRCSTPGLPRDPPPLLAAHTASAPGTASLMKDVYGRQILPVWPLKPVNKVRHLAPLPLAGGFDCLQGIWCACCRLLRPPSLSCWRLVLRPKQHVATCPLCCSTPPAHCLSGVPGRFRYQALRGPGGSEGIVTCLRACSALSLLPAIFRTLGAAHGALHAAAAARGACRVSLRISSTLTRPCQPHKAPQTQHRHHNDAIVRFAWHLSAA